MSAPWSPKPDFTPQSASPTDIAPLGRNGSKPPHERTADDEVSMADWDGIAAEPAFHDLLRSKARFIIPATVFFMVYYFALPVGVGWFPELMEKKVLGDVNVAYLFALSQFVMAWLLATAYMLAASGWDRRAGRVVQKFLNRTEPPL